ncbi:hypothetical protein [Sphingomonas sp. LT1P40]|uniref:hypothetical protein n=1 Tax=Alteristakelama amylovorans TaxID=3096166 RepID=UPI002FC91754
MKRARVRRDWEMGVVGIGGEAFDYDAFGLNDRRSNAARINTDARMNVILFLMTGIFYQCCLMATGRLRNNSRASVAKPTKNGACYALSSPDKELRHRVAANITATVSLAVYATNGKRHWYE